MTPQEELQELREEQRIADLEAKAAQAQQRLKDANAYAIGGDVKKLNAVTRGIGGAKHALDRAALGLKDVFTDLTPEDKELLRQGKAFVEEADTAGKVGEFAGDVGLAIGPGSKVTSSLRLATGAARTLPRALTRLAGEVGAGAGMGWLQAMPEERTKGAVLGAAGSAAGTALNRVAGGAVRPLVREDAEALMRQGVQPTVGQSIGGWANKAEETLTSLPIIGNAVNWARNRALNEFNERAIQQAAPAVRGLGDDALHAAREQISQQYQRALGAMPPHFNVDAHPIIRSAVDAVDDPALALSAEGQRRVLDYVERNLLQRQSNITPEIAKRIESDLGQATSRLMSSSTAEDRAVGEALRRVQADWRNSLTGIGNMYGTGAGDALREADAAWRAFIPLDTAASRVGAQGVEDAAGRFTPKALRRAIEKSDKTANNRATRNSIGDMSTPFNRLNTMTRQGENVLSDRVPDSGTAGRLLLGGGGAGAALASGAALPLALKYGAGGGLAFAGATRAGQQFAHEGLQPALEALARRGIRGEQAARLIEEFGPDVVLAMSRGAAPQQGAPYAPQQ